METMEPITDDQKSVGDLPGSPLGLLRVARALRDNDLTFHVRDAHTLTLGFANLLSYRDSRGNARVQVRIVLRRGIVRIAIPELWDLPSEDHRPAVLETMLRLQSAHRCLRFSIYDLRGTVGVSYGFSADVVGGAEAIPRIIGALVRMVDDIHPEMAAAIDNGTVWESDIAGLTILNRTLVDFDPVAIPGLVEVAVGLCKFREDDINRLMELSGKKLVTLLSALGDPDET